MLAADLVASLSPVHFFEECLGFDADPKQEEVLRYEGRRLLLNCTRQWGKSTVAAAKAYHRGKYTAGQTILLLSPTLRQSKELFHRLSQMVTMDPSPPQMVEDTKLSCTFTNGSRIISLPGSEHSVRGYTADLIVADEASQIPDDLFFTISPMLAVTGGTLIVMSTPRGRRGFFWRAWEQDKTWEKISVVAWECPRIPDDFLQEEKTRMQPDWFSQEYECQFISDEGSLLSEDTIRSAFDANIRPYFESSSALDAEIKPYFTGGA